MKGYRRQSRLRKPVGIYRIVTLLVLACIGFTQCGAEDTTPLPGGSFEYSEEELKSIGWIFSGGAVLAEVDSGRIEGKKALSLTAMPDESSVALYRPNAEYLETLENVDESESPMPRTVTEIVNDDKHATVRLFFSAQYFRGDVDDDRPDVLRVKTPGGVPQIFHLTEMDEEKTLLLYHDIPMHVYPNSQLESPAVEFSFSQSKSDVMAQQLDVSTPENRIQSDVESRLLIDNVRQSTRRTFPQLTVDSGPIDLEIGNAAHADNSAWTFEVFGFLESIAKYGRGSSLYLSAPNDQYGICRVTRQIYTLLPTATSFRVAYSLEVKNAFPGARLKIISNQGSISIIDLAQINDFKTSRVTSPYSVSNPDVEMEPYLLKVGFELEAVNSAFGGDDLGDLPVEVWIKDVSVIADDSEGASPDTDNS